MKTSQNSIFLIYTILAAVNSAQTTLAENRFGLRANNANHELSVEIVDREEEYGDSLSSSTSTEQSNYAQSSHIESNNEGSEAGNGRVIGNDNGDGLSLPNENYQLVVENENNDPVVSVPSDNQQLTEGRTNDLEIHGEQQAIGSIRGGGLSREQEIQVVETNNNSNNNADRVIGNGDGLSVPSENVQVGESSNEEVVGSPKQRSMGNLGDTNSPLLRENKPNAVEGCKQPCFTIPADGAPAIRPGGLTTLPNLRPVGSEDDESDTPSERNNVETPPAADRYDVKRPQDVITVDLSNPGPTSEPNPDETNPLSPQDEEFDEYTESAQQTTINVNENNDEYSSSQNPEMTQNNLDIVGSQEPLASSGSSAIGSGVAAFGAVMAITCLFL